MQNVHAITVPAMRSLLAPLLRIKDTVPCVVGPHLSVTGWPAVTDRPEGGISNALSAAKAKSGAVRSESMTLRAETMVADY